MDYRGGGEAAKRPSGTQRGSVLVEFSLVFGLFIMLLYALIAFGVMLAAKNSLTHAAAEGARAAIGVVDDPATTTVDERVERAKTRVDEALNWFGDKYQPTDTTASVAPCGTAECITVKITFPYESRPIVPLAPGLGVITPPTFTSTAVVELTN